MAEPVPPGPRVLGFDTVAKLDAQSASALARLGLAFAARYVDLVEGPPSANATDVAEVTALLQAGLGVMLVQFGRTHAWSSQSGKSDGLAAARNTLALGLPTETGLSLDLEGSFQTHDQIVTYAAEWYEAALSVGMHPDALQVYIGAGVLLSPAELYQDLPFRGYWQSASDVPNVARRGYRMRQLRPLDQRIAGVVVDLDVAETDFFGSRPRWVRSAAGLSHAPGSP